MNMQRFFARCEQEGRDPVALLERFTTALRELRVRRPDLVQRIFHELSTDRRLTLADEEPYFPCGWCKDRSIWGEDYCAWTHWFICDWWGFDCIDCGGEPPPE